MGVDIPLIADSMGFPEGEQDMVHRSICQERFGFAGSMRSGSSLLACGAVTNGKRCVSLMNGIN